MEAALAARHEVDASGEIMELTTGGCPWKEHLYALEKEQAVKAPIKYCLYQVSRAIGVSSGTAAGLWQVL